MFSHPGTCGGSQKSLGLGPGQQNLGDGPGRSARQHMAPELGVAGRVFFAGWMEPE